MRLSHLFLAASLLMLTACGNSHRPVYSGHQESTEGVPGFVNGKKVSPHVKLGQSYTVDGETYVPRHQPGYVEEGMASWYGPGFHGGKTANGEVFDKDELTAAHRTLPLPSIVRVTMLSTGKQAYVRVNDRGPFAHSRIIDLSRAAAEKIGLLRAGVAKVRVEYMAEESKRFASLLEQGRDPKSVDMASEILNYSPSADRPTQYARGDTRVASDVAETQTQESGETHVASNDKNFWESVSPVSIANAAEPEPITNESAPVSDVVSADLASPDNRSEPKAKELVASKQSEPEPQESPFSMLETAAGKPAEESEFEVATLPAQADPVSESPPLERKEPVQGRSFVQLGAFQSEANAERLRKQYTAMSELKIVKKPSSSGQTLYHVRMGPYESPEATAKALERVKAAGAEAKIIRE
jgi:rare lipoprotein A